MTHQDVISLAQPIVSVLVLAFASFLGAELTGLIGKARAYLTAHGQAAAAAAVASAGLVINQALMTGAGDIVGQMQAGKLDYTNKADWQAEAERQVALAKARVPDMLAIAAPVEGALVANLTSKVDVLMAAPVKSVASV